MPFHFLSFSSNISILFQLYFNYRKLLFIDLVLVTNNNTGAPTNQIHVPLLNKLNVFYHSIGMTAITCPSVWHFSVAFYTNSFAVVKEVLCDLRASRGLPGPEERVPLTRFISHFSFYFQLPSISSICLTATTAAGGVCAGWKERKEDKMSVREMENARPVWAKYDPSTPRSSGSAENWRLCEM